MELAPLSSVLPREVPLELPSIKFGEVSKRLSILKMVVLAPPFLMFGKEVTL